MPEIFPRVEGVAEGEAPAGVHEQLFSRRRPLRDLSPGRRGQNKE